MGNAVLNAQPRRVYVQERPVVHRAPVAVNSYQREENRRARTALNYFGFPPECRMG